MLLDAPALQMRLGMKDSLGIVERILKNQHWRKFDIDSASLVYVPYWFFNYDIYQEEEGRSRTFSNQMALNAITGELEPILVQVLASIPVERSNEITTDVKFKVEKSIFKKEEVAEVVKIKVAGQTQLPKTAVHISGVNLVFVPVWRVWVNFQAGTHKIDLDGVSGSPLAFKQVPERERGVIEVTQDMLEELKTPQGWIDYSKKAFDWGFGVVSQGSKAAASSGILNYLISTTTGRYVLLGILVLLLLVYILFLKP